MPPFDPYLNWLGISPHEQPPNFYRLLGVILFESNPEVIAQAADRQMYHVATFQSGPHADASQHLLNELAMARACLLDPEQKASYDGYLQELLAQRGERAVAAPPPPAGMSAAPYGQAGGQISPPMSPMGNGYGVGPNGYPPAFGEVPLPQFPLPPQAPQPVAANPLQGMPMPMPQMPQMPVQSPLPDMQYMPQQMQQVPMPQQFAMPGPMPMQGAMPGFMPAPQPIPMPAPLGMQSGYAPQAAPPQPSAPRPAQPVSSPAPASEKKAKRAVPQPPAPVDPLAELTASRPRRRFVRKKQDYSKEMLMGGIVAAVIAVIVLIFLTVNGLDDEKRGMERIADDKAKVFGVSPADKQLVKEAAKKKVTKPPSLPASSFLPPQGTPHANVTVRPLRPNRNDADAPFTPRTFDTPNSRDDAPVRPPASGHPHDGPGNDDDVLGPPEK